jgi:23S rRNA pseudouridine955/2504/2580 synthase
MTIENRQVTADEADIRLDRWLRRHFPVTQGVVEKWCRTGQVRVGGKRVTGAVRLQPGDAVRIPPMPPAPPQQAPRRQPERDPDAVRDVQRAVIYRDDWLIALNKPAGLPVQGGPGITRHLDGMLDALKFGAQDRPRLVHRLDRDTSGVLLLARTPGVAAKLAAAFRGRDVEKTYWAVVVGRLEPKAGRIDMKLTRIRGVRGDWTAPALPDDEDAVTAVTDYETLDATGKHFSLMALRPLTGRTHQLRVHMDEAGTPILGDTKYGGGKSRVEGFASGLHLHARGLRLPHPQGGTLVLEAEIPSHMRETFTALGFQAPAPEPGRRETKRRQ